MNCRTAKDQIMLYAEGDLAPASERRLEAHLRDCRFCRELLEEVRESQVWLKTGRSPDFDEAFFSEIRRDVLDLVGRERIRVTYAPQHWKLNWKLLAAGVALLLLCWAGFRIVKNRAMRNHPGVVAKKDGSSEAPSSGRSTELSPGPPPIAEKRSKPKRHGVYRSTEPARGEIAADTKKLVKLQATSVQDRRPLRIEIQTLDPNVRIIWFVQGEQPASPQTDKDTM